MSDNKYSPTYDDNKFLDTIYVGKRMQWKGRYVELLDVDQQQLFAVTELASATLYHTTLQANRSVKKPTTLKSYYGALAAIAERSKRIPG